MWQECPVCKGKGEVLRDGFTNSVFQTCKVCKGARIISKLTGLPPDYEANKKLHEINEKEFLDKRIKEGKNTYPLTVEQMIPVKNLDNIFTISDLINHNLNNE